MGCTLKIHISRACAGLVLIAVMEGHAFTIASRVEEGDQISVETYRKMGVEIGWSNTRLPLTVKSDGTVEWDEELKKRIDDLFVKFNESGIPVILFVNTLRPIGSEHDYTTRTQKNIAGWEWRRARSFSADTHDIQAALALLVDYLKQFRSFGGIGLDDEPAYVAGGCYNEKTIKAFHDKFNLPPPTADDYLNLPAVVKNNHPLLLWHEFQQSLLNDYYYGLYGSLKNRMNGLPVYFVPSDSWRCGKNQSRPDSTPERPRMSTLGTLDPTRIKAFHLYVQFSINELNPQGWAEQIAAGLCQHQFTPPNVPRNLIPIYHPDPSGKGISPAAFRRYVLQTFAEGASGIAYWPISVFTQGIIDEAIDINNLIKQIHNRTGHLKKLRGSVAVLFSTTTAMRDSLWTDNPIERFEHNHQCDALAYYLFRRGIPFDIILENQLDFHAIKDYSVILSAGIRHLKEDAVAALNQYMENTGKLILDKNSYTYFPALKAAVTADFDARYWYKALKGQYCTEMDMEYQAGLLEPLLGELIPASLAICESSSRKVNINYLTDGRNIFLCLVNNDLFAPVETKLSFNRHKVIQKLPEGAILPATEPITVKIDQGNMKIFLLE